ncbi:MAG: hypothetical protein ABIE94_02580 [archaeon]
MPGFYPHLIAALISAAVVHRIHFKLEFSVAIFIGNLLPDAIKFVFAAIMQGTIYVFHIEHNSLYREMAAATSNVGYWMAFGFVLLGVLLFLYHYHVIKKQKMEEVAKFWGFLLLGVAIHLIMDLLFLEQGVWF